jgi:polar amino acid transport system substrate-binding protein
MLSRSEFGAVLAAGPAARRRGRDRSAPPAAPAKEANLARILRTKKLRVAGFVDEEPYFYKDPATGQWSGLSPAMAGSLAAELSVELTVVESEWTEAVPDLHAGKIDLSYGPAATAQRAMFANFARPLFHDTYAIIARKGFAPKSWAEVNAAGILVAADTGSVREAAARRLARNGAIIGFKTRDEALLAVQSGRADCFIATVLLASTALKKNPQAGQLIVPAPHFRSAFCPVLPYDDDGRFRGVLDAWNEDNRGRGQIREWIVTALAKFGIAAGDLPPDVSF